MSNILKGLLEELDIEETKKLTPHEKFKRSMKRAGYDMDAGAKRLQDLLDKQKKEREEFEKKEKEIKEGPAVDAYMAGKSPAIAHFADKLDKIKEDESMQFAAEITPKISAYTGLEDRKYRGSISEGIKKILENPDYGPTDSGYQQGGWRKMNEQEVSEDLRKWFKEKWVRFGPDGKIRGACARGDDSEGKPKCLPQAKAHALGKKGRKYAAAKKRREDPNPERSGPAKNVATKKKSNEGVQQNMQANYKNYSTQDLLRMIKTIKRDEIGMKIIKAISNELIRRKEGVAEAGMPASVIKSKQRYSKMTPAEFAQAHDNKSDEELKAMAWRHGYGKGSTYYVDKRNKGKKGVSEGFPQPGESSGKAKQFNPNAKVKTREMTLDQILNSVKGIPYVNNVVDDWDAKDYSWGVTKKVIEYAQYLQKNPQSVANLPPLVVIDGQLNDGAHRLSAINLLQKRMDPKNPLWKQVKLKVNFGTSADVASEQGVAEGYSDMSGLMSASNLNNSYIITAQLAEGGKKKFRVKAQNERVAIEKFKKHYSMAKIINVEEEGVKEGSKYPRNPASYHLKKYPVPPEQMVRPVKKPKVKPNEKPEQKPEEKLDELKCWHGYSRVQGVPAGAPGSCKKKTNEEHQQCPECGGAMYEVSLMNEKKDACYYKVKSRYKVWPSAYASGALVKCRKKGAKNWGSKSKSNEGQIYSTGGGAGEAQRWYRPKDNLGETSSILEGIQQVNEVNWKKWAATGALAGAAALSAMNPAQARVSPQDDGSMSPSFAQQVSQNSMAFKVIKDIGNGFEQVNYKGMNGVRDNENGKIILISKIPGNAQIVTIANGKETTDYVDIKSLGNETKQALQSISNPVSSGSIPKPTQGVSVEGDTLTFNGKNYDIVKIYPNGPSPRLSQIDGQVNVSPVDFGIRSMGVFTAKLKGNTAYVYID